MKKAKNILLVLTFQLAVGFVFGQNNIQLITPIDGDTIDTKHPLLTWSYMGGLPVSNVREYYRLVLVELRENQSAAAGVIVNSPLIKMDHLVGMQMFYPYDAPELKDGHRYGWQIYKIVNNVQADKSEAFEFILPLPKEEFNKYTTLKKQFDGTYYEAKGGKIFFKMDEVYNTSNLPVVIYDASMQKVQKAVQVDEKDEDNNEDVTNSSEFTILNTGTNFYELDLGTGMKAGIYELNVYDAKKQKYILKFKINL